MGIDTAQYKISEGRSPSPIASEFKLDPDPEKAKGQAIEFLRENFTKLSTLFGSRVASHVFPEFSNKGSPNGSNGETAQHYITPSSNVYTPNEKGWGTFFLSPDTLPSARESILSKPFSVIDAAITKRGGVSCTNNGGLKLELIQNTPEEDRDAVLEARGIEPHKNLAGIVLDSLSVGIEEPAGHEYGLGKLATQDTAPEELLNNLTPFVVSEELIVAGDNKTGKVAVLTLTDTNMGKVWKADEFDIRGAGKKIDAWLDEISPKDREAAKPEVDITNAVAREPNEESKKEPITPLIEEPDTGEPLYDGKPEDLSSTQKEAPRINADWDLEQLRLEEQFDRLHVNFGGRVAALLRPEAFGVNVERSDYVIFPENITINLANGAVYSFRSVPKELMTAKVGSLSKVIENQNKHGICMFANSTKRRRLGDDKLRIGESRADSTREIYAEDNIPGGMYQTSEVGVVSPDEADNDLPGMNIPYEFSRETIGESDPRDVRMLKGYFAAMSDELESRAEWVQPEMRYQSRFGQNVIVKPTEVREGARYLKSMQRKFYPEENLTLYEYLYKDIKEPLEDYLGARAQGLEEARVFFNNYNLRAYVPGKLAIINFRGTNKNLVIYNQNTFSNFKNTNAPIWQAKEFDGLRGIKEINEILGDYE